MNKSGLGWLRVMRGRPYRAVILYFSPATKACGGRTEYVSQTISRSHADGAHFLRADVR